MIPHSCKMLSVFIGAALLIVFTTHCSPANLFTSAATPEPITLQLIGFNPEDSLGQAEQQILDQYQATHAQIHFDRNVAGGLFEELVASAEPPELMWVFPTFPLDEAIRQQQLTDLTDVWLQSGLLDNHPAGLQALSLHDGKQYYVPLAYGWAAVYYNKAIFAQYDLTPPQSWEEFMLLCDTLLANGVTPLSLSGQAPTGIMWFEYLNLRLNGAAFHRDLLTGKISYTDERVYNVFERWLHLFTNGYFIENPYRFDDRSSLRSVIQGESSAKSQPKAAMILTDSLLVAELPADSQAELDFFSFPLLDPAIPVAQSVIPLGYVAPAKAAHAPEAVAFLTYLASAEAQTTLTKHLAGGSVTVAPTRIDIDATFLTPALHKALALVQASDDLVPTLWTVADFGLIEVLDQEYRQFLNEPHDAEKFILRLEEGRQQAANE